MYVCRGVCCVAREASVCVCVCVCANTHRNTRVSACVHTPNLTLLLPTSSLPSPHPHSHPSSPHLIHTTLPPLDMMTVPGLATRPGFFDVDIDTETGRVIGLF